MMKLAKYIAHTGYCSRRKAETLIASGIVKVNGVIETNVAVRVEETDQISINNKLVHLETKATTIMLNKPIGYLSTCNDEQGRETVLDLLPKNLQHLKPVGRLDKNTEGLLLLTNDGELHHKLTHPSYHCEKEYVVTVKGEVSDGALKSLQKGVTITLDDDSTYTTQPAQLLSVAKRKTTTQIHIVISEGKKRQIRKMCEAINHTVTHLKRVRIGNLAMKHLATGKWKELSRQEIQHILP